MSKSTNKAWVTLRDVAQRLQKIWISSSCPQKVNPHPGTTLFNADNIPGLIPRYLQHWLKKVCGEIQSYRSSPWILSAGQVHMPAKSLCTATVPFKNVSFSHSIALTFRDQDAVRVTRGKLLHQHRLDN